MIFINPYTKEEYKQLEEIYEEHLKNNLKIYEQILKLVFGKTN